MDEDEAKDWLWLAWRLQIDIVIWLWGLFTPLCYNCITSNGTECAWSLKKACLSFLTRSPDLNLFRSVESIRELHRIIEKSKGAYFKCKLVDASVRWIGQAVLFKFPSLQPARDHYRPKAFIVLSLAKRYKSTCPSRSTIAPLHPFIDRIKCQVSEPVG